MGTIKINRMSDTSIRMSIYTTDGVRVNPSLRWFKVHLTAGGRRFVAICNPDGENQGCHIDNDVLIIDVPSRHLGVGNVEYMIQYRQKNSNFPDGYRDVFPANWSKTNIEMV